MCVSSEHLQQELGIVLFHNDLNIVWNLQVMICMKIDRGCYVSGVLFALLFRATYIPKFPVIPTHAIYIIVGKEEFYFLN
jgi:Na+-transporting NADH:ubiquinone oxidoreductase subunit NqrB